MNFAYEPRLSVVLNGIMYTTGILAQEVFDELGKGKDEGYCDTQKATIYISDKTPDVRRPAVFWHEAAIHGAFGEMSREAIARLLMCKPAEAKDAEENLACFLGPILSAAFTSRKLYRALAGPIGSRRGRKLVTL